MKIRKVLLNNRKRAFQVQTATKTYSFPYAKLDRPPADGDRIARVFVDKEAGREAFTYVLESDREGTIHIEQVLEYNQDPRYLRDQLLYRLTLEAQKRVEASPLAKREIVRRLGTSATQFYRLMDTTNYAKSLDQMLVLLQVLDCDVDFVVRAKSA